MKKSTVLKRALGKIKKGWNRGAEARNNLGDIVPVSSSSAVSFCSIGAIGAVAHNYYLKDDCFRILAKKLDNISVPPGYDAVGKIVKWNDDPKRTKEEVIKVFEEAIKLAEKKESK